MTYRLSQASLAKLQGVHPDLVRVVERAIATTKQDFMVIEGVRSKARQRDLFAQGRTKPGKVVTWTMTSRHITGHAVDLAPHPLDWNDSKKFNNIAAAMLAASVELNIPVRWGKDWDGDGIAGEKGEADSPHFELYKNVYP